MPRGVAGLDDQPVGTLGVALEEVVGEAEGHPGRHQAGLGAVVQVALDPPQLGGAVVDRVGARGGQVDDPLLQLLGVAAREEGPVEAGAQAHDVRCAVPPEGAGDEQQQHHDGQQREREADGHRHQHPQQVTPGHRVDGPGAQSSHGGQSVRGEVAGRHGVPERGRGHRPVLVGDPAQRWHGEQQERDADGGEGEHAADHDQDEHDDRRDHQEHLAGGEGGDRPRSGWLLHAPILSEARPARSGPRSTTAGGLVPSSRAARAPRVEDS